MKKYSTTLLLILACTVQTHASNDIVATNNQKDTSGASEKQLDQLKQDYFKTIDDKVRSHWTFSATLKDWGCDVFIKQDKTGKVLLVLADTCTTKSSYLSEKIERAIWSASPLPLPLDKRLFDEEILIHFKVNIDPQLPKNSSKTDQTRESTCRKTDRQPSIYKSYTVYKYDCTTSKGVLTYSGQIRENTQGTLLYHGYGHSYYSNKNESYGYWSNHTRHGQHTYIFNSGSKFEGAYKNGKPISGQYTYENNKNLREFRNFQYRDYNVVVLRTDHSITYGENIATLTRKLTKQYNNGKYPMSTKSSYIEYSGTGNGGLYGSYKNMKLTKTSQGVMDYLEDFSEIAIDAWIEYNLSIEPDYSCTLNLAYKEFNDLRKSNITHKHVGEKIYVQLTDNDVLLALKHWKEENAYMDLSKKGMFCSMELKNASCEGVPLPSQGQSYATDQYWEFNLNKTSKKAIMKKERKDYTKVFEYSCD